jgi:hypothetical protein
LDQINKEEEVAKPRKGQVFGHKRKAPLEYLQGRLKNIQKLQLQIS